MEMVRYWKKNEKIEAKLTYNKDGVQIMKLSGEKYDFPGFPRGHLLFGPLSKLKHEIKNQIFNDSWAMLEAGRSELDVAQTVKYKVLPKIFMIAESVKYDMIPPERMVPAVREIHRAWTKVAPGETSCKLRDILTLVLQEDDGYRFRVQWLVNYFNPRIIKFFTKKLIDKFDFALSMLEHGEVIDDMKERQRLLRRILLALFHDKHIREKFLAFVREVDWSKVALSKADSYYFRGKYFRVDLPLFPKDY